MKVRMYIKNKCCSDYYHLDAEFPCAPRVGEIVSVNWDPVKKAIIENDDLFEYWEYLPRELALWYVSPKLQKTQPKPTKEQLWEGLCFDSVGQVDSVFWVVKDGEARCEIYLESLEPVLEDL